MEKNVVEEEIDLKELFFAIKSKIGIILLSGIICAIAIFFYSNYIVEPIYTSTTKLYILSKTSTITSLTDIQIGTQLTQDYMVLIKSRPVVEKVIENLGLDITYEDMLENISITNQSNTRILEISATNKDASLAKDIVDMFAKVSSTRIAKIMDMQEPNIVEDGHVAQKPTSPNIPRNTIIGFAVGILVSGFFVVFIYMMDDTIKSSDDIEKYLQLNTLAMIPFQITDEDTKNKSLIEKLKHKSKVHRKRN